ncbi:MAG: YbaK/EbsC family protein [Parcubacteria group bacterium]|jgi:prolyl-tRNA editing enzyme YbaK/EbsC (Cys-tRNA(Pro) deacylase)
MAISKKILNYLNGKKYKFEIIRHKTTYTAFDTARTTQKHEKKVKQEEIAKTLVMKIDKEYVLAIIPANKRLDKKKFLKAVNMDRKKRKEENIKSVDFAKEGWMKKNIPGKVGATAPFREYLGLDIYADAVLAKQKYLFAGSGEYEYSIKIPSKIYFKIEEPKKGSFTAKK